MLAVDPHSRANPDLHREALGVVPLSCHSPQLAPGQLRKFVRLYEADGRE
jgi:hypothetical protein